MNTTKLYRIINKQTNKPITRGYASKASWKTWPSEAIKGLDPDNYYVQEYSLVPTAILDLNRNKISTNKNSSPSSYHEAEDRCPTCGEPCNLDKDLDDKDFCNNCRTVEP